MIYSSIGSFSTFDRGLVEEEFTRIMIVKLQSEIIVILKITFQ